MWKRVVLIALFLQVTADGARSPFAQITMLGQKTAYLQDTLLGFRGRFAGNLMRRMRPNKRGLCNLRLSL